MFDISFAMNAQYTLNDFGPGEYNKEKNKLLVHEVTFLKSISKVKTVQCYVTFILWFLHPIRKQEKLSMKNQGNAAKLPQNYFLSAIVWN